MMHSPLEPSLSILFIGSSYRSPHAQDISDADQVFSVEVEDNEI